MTAACHRNDADDDICGAHGKLTEAIEWLKGGMKWVVTLVGVSAVTLLMTFGAVLKFGLDMSAANKEMQQQIVYLTKDVTDLKGKTVELEKSDKQLCDAVDKLRKAKGFGGVKSEAEHAPGSE